jgi:signal peptide peptidase SppA
MNPRFALAARLVNDVPMLPEPYLWLWIAQAAKMLNDPAWERAEMDAAGTDAKTPDFPVTRNGLGVATVTISGALVPGPGVLEKSFYGMKDTLELTKLLNGLATDAQTRAVVLHFRSPGGAYTGGAEAAAAIRRLAAAKPTVSFTDTQCASLAYWLASQANEVVATPTASVGSVGVYSSVVDLTKMLENAGIRVEYFVNRDGAYKAAGMPGLPLNDTHRAYFQERVDEAYEQFREEVEARRPNINRAALNGKVYYGKTALKHGLVDRLGEGWFAEMLAGNMASRMV